MRNLSFDILFPVSEPVQYSIYLYSTVSICTVQHLLVQHVTYVHICACNTHMYICVYLYISVPMKYKYTSTIQHICAYLYRNEVEYGVNEVVEM